jgi:hypothetical protein
VTKEEKGKEESQERRGTQAIVTKEKREEAHKPPVTKEEKRK